MRVLKWLDEHLEEAILMVLLIVMTIVMGVQVVMRYVFNESLTWSEELVRYLFVWSAFISIGYCIKNGLSIRIDQFVNMLPKSRERVLWVITQVVMLAFFCYVFIFSIDVFEATYGSGQKSPALLLPFYLVQMSVVLGFGLAVIRIIQNLIKAVKPTKQAN